MNRRAKLNRAGLAALGAAILAASAALYAQSAGVVHDARNDGAAPARVVGVYVVEKGKPLATPAPGQPSK